MRANESLGALEELRQVAGSLCNRQVREWKGRGGKVVGCFYSYIPEEIIAAGGLLPFRLRATGSTGTELSDARLSQINCSFVRHTLDAALRGDMSFLDGLVAFKQCDQVFRLYEHWVAGVPTSFTHFVVVPKKRGEAQRSFYQRELGRLARRIEEHFGVEITDESLRGAIVLHNETRRLQRELYGLMKRTAPPLTGAELLAVMVAGTAMPKEIYNGLLGSLLKQVDGRDPRRGTAVRLMLIGKEQDTPELAEVIESQGGVIVADDLSFGMRGSWTDVSVDDDPLGALARAYLDERPPCPRLFGTGPARYAFLKSLAAHLGVEGVVLARHPFCDQWAFEEGSVTEFLRKERIPLLKLQTEYPVAGVGQLKTRIQAFLETIQEARA